MRRLFAILLAAAMLFMLCSCGSAAAGTASAPEVSAAEDNTAATAEEAAEAPASETPAEAAGPAEEASAVEEASAEEAAPAEEPAPDLEEAYETMYPIQEEGVSLTFMINLGGFVFQFMENGDLNQTIAAQIQEEETGIHIEYQGVDQDAYSDRFSLMVASEDYTDMCATPEMLYPGGIDGLIDDEVMVNINDYLDVMPHFAAFGQEHPEFIKSMTSDSGNLVSIWNYVPDTDYCVMYRQDLLEQVGLDIPETYDELHEVLTAFKNETDVKTPLEVGRNGTSNCAWMGGYDCAISSDEEFGWLVDDDGNVVCSTVSDNMRDFLTLWSQWYAEGLMTKDFISQESNTRDPIITGSCGATYNMMTCVSDSEREAYGISMVCAPDVTINKGDIIHTGINEHPTNKGSGSIGITTACEYPEVAAKWLNWFFTEKGTVTYNFGVQGETYDIDADGNYYYTDAIINNELGLPAMLATSMLIGWPAMSFPRMEERTTAFYTNDDERGMMDLWYSNRDNAHVYFGDLTAEESSAYSATASDILTYASENISGFIMGARPMSEWDSFVQTCYDMGIQDLIDLKQAAYDRYLER